ncbi:hypothetical protein [uncultured Methanobacterium sp.]|uniref:DUF7352 domain-containing protein n=1 Tax=uncultured Methanobacterium sp. TaxID=176306 RepID=UPI002AA761DC|nr:hypothetical protein [uncultured Methanobacterium sp.]
MKKIVYKYPLRSVLNDISMPKDAQIILVGEQYGLPCIWAEVVLPNKETEYETRVFEVVGTGKVVAHNYLHRGSYVDDTPKGKAYVFHVYEVIQ